MSRKAKVPISLPSGVNVKSDGNFVTVKGPKGEQTWRLLPMIEVVIDEQSLQVRLKRENDAWKKFLGLYYTLINNMVIGVSKGFDKRLVLIGTGYRASVQGSRLVLQVGKSHPTELDIPSEIQVSVEKNTTIIVSGANKQKVGQFCADVRSIRPPEPYQGKGIRYENEYVRRKAGKAAAKK